jgi:uncharacterized protein (TIGR04255 family)
LLDIRVELPKTTKLEDLKLFREKVKAHYPLEEQRVSWQAGLGIKEGKPTLSLPKGEIVGFLYKSSDGKKILQARLDGFTLNKLRPYDNWEKFVSEAKTYWRIYSETVKPSRISRIALRYINRIEIPIPFGDFTEYLLTTPEIADGIPQGMSEFLMRIVIPDEEAGGTAIITQTIDSNKTLPDRVPIIFDVDVFKVPGDNFSEEVMWDSFEKLRVLKNKIFFNSITAKTEELFK